ncbi:MAG: pantoate--beta-alanine ligase [Candidatus Omnitrophota bacterium]
MKIFNSIKEIRKEISREKQKGFTVGLVPTMGYLHEGHLSLIKKARRDSDVVVVSIFVNPVQFGPKEDYRKYPRNLKRDAGLCEKEGVDYIFSPSPKSMYPVDYSTFVCVEGLTENLCGKFRPGHFKGVATVVSKLFNIIEPDFAYFGQKDAQQAIAIKRMARDLNMGAKVKIMPTVRDADGLAMSSRNIYLSPKERGKAPTIYRALQEARNLIKLGERNSNRIISKIRVKLLPAVTKIDYISVVDLSTLKDIKVIKSGVLIAAAVWMGQTRLIDNIIVKG